MKFVAKIDNLLEITVLIDIITDLLLFHLEIDKNCLQKAIFALNSHFIELYNIKTTFLTQKQIMETKCFFLSKKLQINFFNPYFFDSKLVYCVRIAKKLNKLYKNQILINEEQFLSSKFLDNTIRFVTSFIQLVKISKLGFDLKKKEKIVSKIKETINFFYKAIFKLIFNKFIFSVGIEKNYNEENEKNLMNDFFKAVVLFELTNMNHCNLLIIQAINENIKKIPNNFAVKIRNFGKFQLFFSENYNFVYFSQERTLKLVKSKKNIQELVIFLKI